MRTAVVIGARSMFGAEVVRRLRAEGVTVLSVGRGPEDDIILDLDRYQEELPHGLPILDVVFHCAAAFANDSEGDLWNNCMNNTVGSLNVLMLMRHLQCATCVYAGSIFSSPGVEQPNRSGYGMSKALREQIFAWKLLEQGGAHTFCSLRFHQFYDVAGHCCKHQPWFGRIVAYASRGLVLNIRAPAGPRNFLHSHDAARLLIQVGRNRLTGTWEVCHPESLDYLQIAQRAYDVFGVGGRVKIDSAKTQFRPLAFPSGGTLFDRVGMRAEVTMTEGLIMIRDAGSAQDFGPMDVQ